MIEIIKPMDIEKRSFEIITELLGEKELDPENELVIKRVIHTTADFEYAESLVFSEHAVGKGIEALKAGCNIVTDTQMANSGINKAALKKLGCEVHCFMSDEDVAIGNAPTALIRIKELFDQGKINPALVIGVPVGFVNVVESKELIIQSEMPHIVARGRKGGSNVAAAICNAMMYQITR